MKEGIMLKKQNLEELFEKMYNDDGDQMLNLFCVSLISSDSVLTEQDCINNMEILF